MRIPKRENIICTGLEDPLSFYYHSLTGRFYLKRLQMAKSLFYGRKYSKLLDIGYGCGIFFPELSLLADGLYGIDTHNCAEKVGEMLEKENLRAELLQGSIYKLPYNDAVFDGIVAVSVLEHMDNLENALKEVKRVMAPRGTAVFGFPVKNKLTDMLFSALGFEHSKHHVSSHDKIIQYASRIFYIEKFLKFPAFLPINLGLYAAIRCVKKG